MSSDLEGLFLDSFGVDDLITVLVSERAIDRFFQQRGALYSQRKWMAEPVFGQIKTNRRIDRFKRRGHAAVRSEWRLIAATHNLMKLYRHHTQPAGA